MAKVKSDVEKTKPTIYFDYEFCKDAKIGDEVEFEGKGKITSLSENEYEGKKSMAQSLEISKIKKKGEKEGTYEEALKKTRRAAFDKE